MAAAVYILGALTSLAAALLLLRGFFRGRQRLLLWSGICFLGLALSNLMVFIDLVLFPNVDFYLVRLAIAAVAMFVFVAGLIWESE